VVFLAPTAGNRGRNMHRSEVDQGPAVGDENVSSRSSAHPPTGFKIADFGPGVMNSGHPTSRSSSAADRLEINIVPLPFRHRAHAGTCSNGRMRWMTEICAFFCRLLGLPIRIQSSSHHPGRAQAKNTANGKHPRMIPVHALARRPDFPRRIWRNATTPKITPAKHSAAERSPRYNARTPLAPVGSWDRRYQFRAGSPALPMQPKIAQARLTPSPDLVGCASTMGTQLPYVRSSRRQGNPCKPRGF
jgi:hypothetical protein